MLEKRIFIPQQTPPKFVVRTAPASKKMLLAMSPPANVENLQEQKAQAKSDDFLSIKEDPFLEEWQRQNHTMSDVSKDPTFSPVYPGSLTLASRRQYQRNLFTDLSGSTAVTQPESSPVTPLVAGVQKSDTKSSKWIIEDGRTRPAHVLNYMESENQYLSYANVEGFLSGLVDASKNYFFEVVFYDQLGSDGLETPYSTILAAQEIYDLKTMIFSLRLPVESRGYLLAKVYARNDVQKKTPLFMGRVGQKMVPKEGIRNLKIEMLPTQNYLEKYATIFEGIVESAYDGSLSDVNIWVAETNESVTSNANGVFQIKGLERNTRYHLIFDRKGFVPVQVPVFQTKKRHNQTFKLLPESAFTRGYDVFLGPRNSDQAILFGKVLKDGTPLDRVVVKISSKKEAVYERDLELGAMPDTTLYSTQNNGKFMIWNTPVGKHVIEFYRDGLLISKFLIRLSPGLVHQETFEIH